VYPAVRIFGFAVDSEGPFAVLYLGMLDENMHPTATVESMAYHWLTFDTYAHRISYLEISIREDDEDGKMAARPLVRFRLKLAHWTTFILSSSEIQKATPLASTACTSNVSMTIKARSWFSDSFHRVTFHPYKCQCPTEKPPHRSTLAYGRRFQTRRA
jgi:hypothetical protein